MFLRRRPQPHRSCKRKDLVEDQPFPGLLRTENVSLEELAHVLRAAVVDQKGEGSLLLLRLRSPVAAGAGPPVAFLLLASPS